MKIDMKKIIVIGCPGSGKSTFSKVLHKYTGIPLYHLDRMYWNQDQTTVAKSVFQKRLSNVMKQNEWIIDGNYGATLDIRLQVCDTVCFLDYPTDVCLDGIQKRKGKARSDMPWIEIEDDPELLSYINDFQALHRPKIMNQLNQYKDKIIYVFKNRTQADEFLNQMK